MIVNTDSEAGVLEAEQELFRVEIRPGESGNLLVLAGEISLDAAGRLREASLEAAAAARDVVIDWSEAGHVSAGALQLLLALRAALEAGGRRFDVVGDHPGVRQSLELAGLSRLFPTREVPG